MCGNNNTFVRKSGSNTEAPGVHVPLSGEHTSSGAGKREGGGERNFMPCIRDPKPISKQIIK